MSLERERERERDGVKYYDGKRVLMAEQPDEYLRTEQQYHTNVSEAITN
jgi:hypothetical protein